MDSKKLFDDSHYLELAAIGALKSNCLKAGFGCVIISCDDRIISTGHNKTIDDLCSEKGCNRKNIQAGHSYEDCMSIHAEMMAIAEAARKGVSLENSTLYLYRYGMLEDDYVSTECEPCRICKKIIIFSGIKEVVTKYKKFKVTDWEARFRELINKEGY